MHRNSTRASMRFQRARASSSDLNPTQDDDCLECATTPRERWASNFPACQLGQTAISNQVAGLRACQPTRATSACVPNRSIPPPSHERLVDASREPSGFVAIRTPRPLRQRRKRNAALHQTISRSAHSARWKDDIHGKYVGRNQPGILPTWPIRGRTCSQAAATESASAEPCAAPRCSKRELHMRARPTRRSDRLSPVSHLPEQCLSVKTRGTAPH